GRALREPERGTIGGSRGARFGGGISRWKGALPVTACDVAEGGARAGDLLPGRSTGGRANGPARRGLAARRSNAISAAALTGRARSTGRPVCVAPTVDTCSRGPA